MILQYLYDFRCVRCDWSTTKKRSADPVTVTCRTCRVDVRWWRKRPSEAFVKPRGIL